MERLFWQLLSVYLGFMILASLLVLIRRWIRPGSGPSNVWHKYPLYILLNIVFFLAVVLPREWHMIGLLAALIGCGASWEISQALGLTKIECVVLPVITAGLILSAEWLPPTPFVKAWLVLMLFAVVSNGLAGQPASLGRRFLGIAAGLGYFPLCLVAFVWIRQTETGYFGAIFVYGVIAINDAFAQITGQLVGHRQLAPHISPAKTIEGAVGGILFAAFFGASICPVIGWSYAQGALTGAGLAIAGITGDLTVSSWKRALGLKDFSNLMGAHGGVLDRFDAFILAAPVFFLLSVR